MTNSVDEARTFLGRLHASASELGTKITITLQRKLGAGFFGGESLFLATLRGNDTQEMIGICMGRILHQNLLHKCFGLVRMPLLKSAGRLLELRIDIRLLQQGVEISQDLLFITSH